jgi:hypothetical protein
MTRLAARVVVVFSSALAQSGEIRSGAMGEGGRGAAAGAPAR